jgi:hypothetical protein
VTKITLRYVALIQVDFIYPEKTLISGGDTGETATSQKLAGA